MLLRALVVGCGLSGAVVARKLADKGVKVTIWERRDHIGGNMYDYVDEHGILVHKYGPHTFHTNKKELYDFICQYAEWDEYHLTCGAEINGRFTPTPFNFKTIDDFHTEEKAGLLKEKIKKIFGDREMVTVVEALECDDPLIKEYAQFLFDNDYSLYTAKQWGVPVQSIDVSVLKRVPLRFSYKEGYFDDKYQVMPRQRYTVFFEALLNHPNITVELGKDALQHLNISEDGRFIQTDISQDMIPVIYTGALDELFANKLGDLPYRSLRFESKYENMESKQPWPVVAYPQADGYTRIVEYKKLPVQKVQGTTYVLEYSLPYKAGERQEPYYPVLTEESQKMHEEYAAMAGRVENLYCCGRLADFKYYNMDQALDRALQVAEKLIKRLLHENLF